MESASCSCENGKYLASIMGDSAITFDEIMKSFDEEAKTILTNFNEKKATCKAMSNWFHGKKLMRNAQKYFIFVKKESAQKRIFFLFY